ncbi:MAG: hypothetical protein K2K24_01155, partial [Clostridia bacterium]|nr:hypothetical protein [Clostridia bacterium]
PVQDQKVRITGLPDGLTITDTNYRDNSKRAADKYTAKIVGTLGNANASNYYTPSVTDKNTYIYNKDDGVFPWTLEWEIKPKEITLTWIQKASDNNDFTYWVVVGEEAELIEQNGYLFYAEENYDDLTGTPTGDSIQLSEITVPKREVHYYWVVAVLKDAKNYTMANKAQSFSVGSLKEMVKVKLKDTEPFIYNGSPYGQEIIVESDESILTSAQIDKTYYNVNDRDNPLSGAPINAGKYILVLDLKEGLGLEEGYELTVKNIEFEIEQAEVEIALSKNEYKYDGQEKAGDFQVTSNNYNIDDILLTYYKETKDFKLDGDKLPCDAGKYIVVLSLPNDENNYRIKSGCEELEFTIAKAQIVAKWVNGENNVPMLSGLDETTKAIVGYVYYDEDGNPLDDNAQLESGKSYKVKAVLLDDNAKNYEFVTEDGQATPNESAETAVETFTITASNSGGSLGGVNGFDFSKILDALKNNWQPILAAVSLLFTIIFMGKGIGYAGKRKKVKKTIDKRYTAYYAISGVGLFGLPNTTWTVIACIMAGVAILAFIFMLLQKRMYNKALEDMEDAKEEYTRNREESNFMRYANGGMNGGMGMGQQGVVYTQQPQFALEDMRGMINEAMSNMLPTVQQY